MNVHRCTIGHGRPNLKQGLQGMNITVGREVRGSNPGRVTGYPLALFIKIE